MKRTYLFLLVLFLVLTLIVSATPMTQLSPVDKAIKMIIGFPQKCYEEQGGDLLFISEYIPEKFKFYALDKTFEEKSNPLWELLQKEIAMKYCNEKSPSSCIEDTIQKMTVIPRDSNIKNACGYAPDKNVCEKCVADKKKNYEEKQQMQKYIENGILMISVIISSLSFLYLIFSGIFYLIKKRLPIPRWLFFLALGLFLIWIITTVIMISPM